MLLTAADYHYQHVGDVDVERVPIWISATPGMPMRLSDMLYLSEALNVVENAAFHPVREPQVYYDIRTDLLIFESFVIRKALTFFFQYYQSSLYPSVSYFFVAGNEIPEMISAPSGLLFEAPQMRALSIAENYEDHPDFINRPWESGGTWFNKTVAIRFLYDAFRYMDRFKCFINTINSITTGSYTLRDQRYEDSVKTSDTSTYHVIDHRIFAMEYYSYRTTWDIPVKHIETNRLVENLQITATQTPGAKKTIKNIILGIGESPRKFTYYRTLPVNATQYSKSFSLPEVKQLLALVGLECGFVGIEFAELSVEYDFEA